jgi:hypothetical protein
MNSIMVKVKRRTPIESVTITMDEEQAYVLKMMLENLCFNHQNAVPYNFDQTHYYPLKRALKGIECSDG